MQTSKGDFGKGSVASLIIAQALPLTLAQLVQLIYNVIDRIYLGHMPGAADGVALTGVGLTFPIISLIAAFTNLFATGGAPLCAIARGKQDDERALSIEVTTLSMQIIGGIVYPLIIFTFQKPLLYLLGASDTTYSYASAYLGIYLLGTIFVTTGTGMSGFINLQGYASKAMLYMMAGAVINIILDPIFIFVLNMGVAGAALASVIAQALCCSLVLSFLFSSKAILPLRPSMLLRADYSLLKDIIPLGLAGFIMSATNCLVQAVCNKTLSIHGGDIYVGIMTIINSVREMIGLPINGITAGAQPVISYNYGAKSYKRVRRGIRFMSLTGISYTAIMWALILLMPRFFLSIFTSEEKLVDTGVTPLMIYFFGFIFMSLQFASQSTFVALGKARQSIFFSLFRKVIIVVPLTLILPGLFNLGVKGVFLAEPISNLLGGMASFLTMYFGTYRKMPRE
ncbi:MATE family efflux transporter [Butyrivibrio sp. MC2013]|uniref:MATE family efflux transporter n=1 Tax=Butyrivibrio sp. MC2013 TaxID=1280686 RepID=UPI0004162DAC|nr:MATE family efflux transporter [Butyrivibrio sp. MC2013]